MKTLSKLTRLTSVLLAFAGVTAAWAGQTCGVGLALAKHAEGFTVSKILTNSPAAVEGSIHEGDLLIEVAQTNGSPVPLKGLDIFQAVDLIRGPKGTQVRLTIVPSATNIHNAKVVSLIRAELVGLSLGGLWQSLTNGAMAPAVTLYTLPGKRATKLSDYLGRPVILEFWATWCAPCVKLMPAIQKTLAPFAKGADLVVMTVSIDESGERAWERLSKERWTQTDSAWGDKAVIEGFGIHAIPQMFVINREGRVVYSGAPLEAKELEKLLQNV